MHSTRTAYIKDTWMERVAKTKPWPGSPAAFVCLSSRIGNLWKGDPATRLSWLWIANCQWNGIVSLSFILQPQWLLSIILTRKAWGRVGESWEEGQKTPDSKGFQSSGESKLAPGDFTQVWQVWMFNTTHVIILYFSRSKFICSESLLACLMELNLSHCWGSLPTLWDHRWVLGLHRTPNQGGSDPWTMVCPSPPLSFCLHSGPVKSDPVPLLVSQSWCPGTVTEISPWYHPQGLQASTQHPQTHFLALPTQATASNWGPDISPCHLSQRKPHSPQFGGLFLFPLSAQIHVSFSAAPAVFLSGFER